MELIRYYSSKCIHKRLKIFIHLVHRVFSFPGVFHCIALKLICQKIACILDISGFV